jgi:hypothetical protein
MTPSTRACLLGLLASCLLTAAVAGQGRSSFPPGGRGTPVPSVGVEIIELRAAGTTYDVRVRTTGPGDGLQVLLFVQDQRSYRFKLAANLDQNGRPVFPRVSHSDRSASPPSAVWTSTFTSPLGDAPLRLVAIACARGLRAQQNPEKEADAFRFLPFGAATTEEELFRILEGFEWRPLGYTDVHINPRSL